MSEQQATPSGPKVKKFMFVNRKAPYGTIYALESLEVAFMNWSKGSKPRALASRIFHRLTVLWMAMTWKSSMLTKLPWRSVG